MNKTLKWFLIIVSSGVLLFLGFAFFVFSIFSFDNGRSYSTQDLIDNYKSKTGQISDISNYINSIVPDNKSVDIEFDGSNKFFIFHVVDNGDYDNNWDLKLNAPKVDALLEKLNWNVRVLKTLKEKLDAANCISVESGEPCKIGFQRSGMGKYYYNIFTKPIAESLKTHYNDSCTYIFYNDKLVLEYGGGAIGPQCFPKQ